MSKSFGGPLPLETSLDPARLKQAGGRPVKYHPEELLECLGAQRLRTGEWKKLASEEFGVSSSRFFDLLKLLAEGWPSGQIGHRRTLGTRSENHGLPHPLQRRLMTPPFSLKLLEPGFAVALP
jgi:hypothetical protein